VAGLFLDGWAHYHIRLDTFVTPWHAALYSGFFSTTGYLVWATARHPHGRPLGYDLSLLGAGLFLIGGVCDGIWHTLFGIEQSEQALFSPTHLLIATGGILLVTGPLRASWHRSGGRLGDRMPWPALLSLSFVLFTFALFVEYSHPFFDPLVASGTTPASASLTFQTELHGVLGVLVHSALVTGIVLFALRRWTLPTGSITFLLGGSGALIGLLHDQLALVPLAVLAGIAADALGYLLQPSPTRPSRLRLFTFTIPVAYYAIYLVGLQLIVGLWWTVHMSTGSVVLAGVVGLLLSLLAVPPSAPGAIDDRLPCAERVEPDHRPTHLSLVSGHGKTSPRQGSSVA
jgi:hypothetical protein